jgi:hypothetical protein
MGLKYNPRTSKNMGEILEGISNIIKSGFIVLAEKISSLFPKKKHDKHEQKHH